AHLVSGPLAKDAHQALVLTLQVRQGGRRARVLREMNELHGLVGEIAFEYARQVARRVAYRMEDHAVEAIELIGEAQLQRALDDRAHERLEARVGVRQLDLVAPTEQRHRQHTAGVDELHGGVY